MLPKQSKILSSFYIIDVIRQLSVSDNDGWLLATLRGHPPQNTGRLGLQTQIIN
jgi:hypothetical protein